ncbi:unnamed protein product [Mytilus edulis]|uniref:CARD domain-containing protein n=1 Tax=Mytilus edulis TaxID=6550 RepID=A0A8S3T9C4_MYTED|nr:unnamed protein product [Mytilus edulis]
MDNSEHLITPSDLISDVFPTTSISNSPSNNYARCGLWDFAGQKEFYCTHQAFLTSSAIYLVVVDMKTDFVTEQKKLYNRRRYQFLSDLQEEDYVGFWFDSIHCYRTVDPQDGEASMDPPVVVVFTGKDRYDQNELQERQKYLGDQLSQLHGEQEKYQHYRHKYCISNTEDSDTIFAKIRTKISEIAQKMPLWGTLVPLKWIVLEHLINLNRDSGKHFVSFNDVTKMAKHPEIEIFDEGEVSTFLHFQHEVGNIIFFKDIPDLIILEPQWLANAFRCLVSDRFDIDDVQGASDRDKRQISLDWTLLINKGEISDLLINTLFKLKGGDYFLTQKVQLLEGHIEKGMSKKHSQILQTCSEHMVNNLYNVDMICEYLEVDDILTEEIRDTIKHKNGRQKQTKELLSLLPFRGEKAYERFIEALKITENTNVAHYLEQQVGSTEQGPWVVGENMNGSYFIQGLIHVFKNSACEKSFIELLNEVNACLLQAVVPKLTEDGKIKTVEKKPVAQIVVSEYCEEKELYFFPGFVQKAIEK